jgi:hypothetical protein
MNRRVIIMTAVAASLASTAAGDDNEIYQTDPIGDAVVRRTDPGNDGPINPDSVLPDLVEVRIGAWAPFDPVNDRYTGALIDPDDAHIFRIQLTIKGLVNPPGPIGLAGQPYQPYNFGPSPLYTFVDFDVDSQKNSGGELVPLAKFRYLANAARFNGRPEDSYGQRAVTDWSNDVDDDFFTSPQFERTGAEFALVMCGCWPVTLLSDDANAIFEPGETWLVEGRFFERAQGFQEASGVSGGSDFGLYDPWTEIQFKHDAISDTTTITYVGALDMQGAAALRGGQQQPADTDVENDTSVYEALKDVIAGAGENWSDPVDELIDDWEGRNPEDFLDVTDWEFNALVGTTYSTEQLDSLFYVWTDIGFNCKSGDYNGDGEDDSLDDALFCQTFQDDPVIVQQFALGFNMFDANYDGVIDADDHVCCLADFNGDGALNILDFVAFQSAFQAQDPDADVNNDGAFNILDFVAFQQIFITGC